MTRFVALIRRRWYVALALVALVAGCAYFVRGALDAGAERRASRARIEGLAREVRDQNMRIEAQNDDIKRIATAIDAATSPDARDRSAAVLAGAIAELRRSTDCVALYMNGERPTPCAEVTARMDALRAGLDPFTRPTSGAP